MGRFRFNAGEMELADGWEDRSVVALSYPAGSKSPEASFAVTRDGSLKKEAALDSYVDKQLVDLAKNCPEFELVERRSTILSGEPAHQLDFKWKSPTGATVRQEQTIVRISSGAALTFTATAEAANFEKLLPVFRTFLTTITLSKAHA